MPRILLIDDETLFREMLRAALEGMGHEVVEAANGRIALGLYVPGHFDLVITDLIMPEKEGIETIIELRKLNPKVKIIAMSGGGRVTSVDYLQIARQIGAKKILAKPFLYEEIKAVIDEILAEND